jgi:hypothetical protein
LTDEFHIKVNRGFYATLVDEIKTWDLNKPRGRVNWAQFNAYIKRQQRYCPWLRPRDRNGYLTVERDAQSDFLAKN